MVVTKERTMLLTKSVRGRRSQIIPQIIATRAQITKGTNMRRNALKISIDSPKMLELEIDPSKKQSKLMIDSEVGCYLPQAYTTK